MLFAKVIQAPKIGTCTGAAAFCEGKQRDRADSGKGGTLSRARSVLDARSVPAAILCLALAEKLHAAFGSDDRSGPFKSDF